MYRYNTSSNQFAFRSDAPLTDDQIAYHAPSIVASEAHESRGERYAFIPTIEVIDGLRKEGFQPFEVRQTRTRNASKREYTRHMVRMRHADSINAAGEVPEIMLLNSHDGSSSYQLLGGVFRFICSNGLVAGDVFDDIRIRHTGNVVEDVIEGSYRVLDNLSMITDRIDQYKSVTLTDDDKMALAAAATGLRWDDGKAPIDPKLALLPRRYEDRKNDLWTVSNVIQENLVRGGLRGTNANGKRSRTRAVTGVSEDVKLNKALWSITDHFAKMKVAA